MSVKKLIVCVLSFFLLGCNEKLTYSYLMQHPETLKHQVEKCESMNAISPTDEANCKVVSLAATDFMGLIEEQQKDPEAFGQKILDLEMACANNKNENTAEQDPCQQVKYSLAVVGIHSPE